MHVPMFGEVRWLCAWPHFKQDVACCDGGYGRLKQPSLLVYLTHKHLPVPSSFLLLDDVTGLLFSAMHDTSWNKLLGLLP